MTGRHRQTVRADAEDRDRIAVAAIRGIQEFAVRMQHDLRTPVLGRVRSGQRGDYAQLSHRASLCVPAQRDDRWCELGDHIDPLAVLGEHQMSWAIAGRQNNRLLGVGRQRAGRGLKSIDKYSVRAQIDRQEKSPVGR